MILSDYKYYDVSRFNEENIDLVQDNSSLPWYFINEKGEKINDATYKYFSLLPDGSLIVTIE